MGKNLMPDNRLILLVFWNNVRPIYRLNAETKMRQRNLIINLITILLLLISVCIPPTALGAKPSVISVELDYNDGASPALIVTWSTAIETTSVDETKFHIRDFTSDPDIITLPPETSVVGAVVSFDLTEAQRIAVLAKSGVPGGDGSAVVLNVKKDAVRSISTLEYNKPNNDRMALETADTTRPTIVSVTLNYNDNDRQLVVTFSETIDASATDQTLFHINNTTGMDVVTLTNSTTSPDGTTLTFTLTEAQRVAALAISGTPGGDGGAVVLDVGAGAISDMGTNTNLIDDNNTVAETADTNNPSISSWSLDLSAPTLTLNLSETVNASTRDLTAVTVQDAAAATDSHTLTTSDTTSGDGTSIVVDLSVADKAGIRTFAVNIGTSYLRATNLLIGDTAGNANSVIADGAAMQATAYTGTSAASASNTTIIASRTSLFIYENTTITVTPKNADGANLGTGEPMSLSTTFGSLLGSVSDSGDGTYRQSLTSSVVGNATVTATVGGVVIDQRAVVVFYSIPSSTTTSVNPSTTTSVRPSTSTIVSTSSIVSSSTTTSRKLLWPMAYDKMWGAAKDENLLLLRVFRDEILVNTELGRESVFMLYDNSLEIATLLLQEPSLTMQTKEIIDELVIGIESLLYGDEIEINQDTIDNIMSLLDNFESNASPKLKTAIKKLKKDINGGEVFEQFVITISE